MLAPSDLNSLLNEWEDLQRQIHLKDPAKLSANIVVTSDQIAKMSKEIESKQTKIQTMERKIKEQHNDIERMKSITFASFKANLVGNYKHELEKGQTECLAASQELQTEQRELESLKTAAQLLNAKFGSLEESSILVKSMICRFREIENVIFDGPTPSHPSEDLLEEKTKRMQQQIENLQSVLNCHRNAHSYINDAVNHCRKVIKSLLRAKEFASADLVFDAIILDGIKHGSIDKAQREFKMCKERVEAAWTIYPELKNYFPEGTISTDITQPNFIANVLFDNIFTDYIRQKIKKSLKNAETALHLLIECKTNMESFLEVLIRNLSQAESLHDDALKQLKDVRKDIILDLIKSKKTGDIVDATANQQLLD